MEQARTRLYAARVVAMRTYTVRVSMTSGLQDALARVSAALEGAEPRSLAEFQMYTPSRYFDWKITRRPIEEAMRASAAEMNQHFEEDFVLAKDLGDLEEFANEVLRKTTASG
jgi:hypothetical protein